MKVVEVLQEELKFDSGYSISSNHDSDCCESHWLSFEHLTLNDFEGLEFDLSGDNFFKRIEGYGIELLPLVGHPIRIPGYGSNNGYYSDALELVVTDKSGGSRNFDITDCQEVSG